MHFNTLETSFNMLKINYIKVKSLLDQMQYKNLIKKNLEMIKKLMLNKLDVEKE